MQNMAWYGIFYNMVDRKQSNKMATLSDPKLPFLRLDFSRNNFLAPHIFFVSHRNMKARRWFYFRLSHRPFSIDTVLRCTMGCISKTLENEIIMPKLWVSHSMVHKSYNMRRHSPHSSYFSLLLWSLEKYFTTCKKYACITG